MYIQQIFIISGSERCMAVLMRFESAGGCRYEILGTGVG